MYKTVRQGENSLQYTILPQTEEVLTNSGVKGKGRDYSPSSHSRRISRKLMVYYLAIGFFGLLLTFGTLLFVLVFCGLVPMDLPSHITLKPESSALKSSNRLTTVAPDKSPTKKKELVTDVKLLKVVNTSLVKMDVENNNTTDRPENVSISILTSTVPSSSAPTTVHEWIMPAIKRLQSTTVTPIPTTEIQETTTIKPIEKVSLPYSRQRESNADLMLGHDQNNWTDYDDDDDEDYDLTKLTTETLATTKPLLNQNNVANQIKSTESSIKSTTVVSSVLKKHNKTALKIKSDKYMEMKEHILDDDDEEYKEPLTDEEDITEQSGSDDVKMSHAKGTWLQTRWPFVDPSSYFQWTGYSARDNLLLPAILSAALSALLVLAILCYALRRRQRCKRRIQEIGNLTSDLQAEDNAILLTAENPSEED